MGISHTDRAYINKVFNIALDYIIKLIGKYTNHTPLTHRYGWKAQSGNYIFLNTGKNAYGFIVELSIQYPI